MQLWFYVKPSTLDFHIFDLKIGSSNPENPRIPIFSSKIEPEVDPKRSAKNDVTSSSERIPFVHWGMTTVIARRFDLILTSWHLI